MNEKKGWQVNNEEESVADKNYEVEDYKRNNQLSSGLATTHEQVSDAYMEGTIDAQIENADGHTVDIPRTGYEGSE